MTFKEFQTRVRDIKKESFDGTADHPLQWGIQRARFNEEKLERLVSIAREVPFATAKRRFDAWQRQLVRVRETRQRMERAELGIYENATFGASTQTAQVSAREI